MSLRNAMMNKMLINTASPAAASPEPIRGTGGGLADAVPAALSEGEFVIPADVVAALGEGSSDAGARILQQMIDEIRQGASQQMEEKAQVGAQGLQGAV
jgi:hypothetical protein